MKPPKLIPINLNKRCSFEEHSLSDHPDIDENTTYLALIDGNYVVGEFSYQWYGLNFSGVYDSGYQLDWDGWEALWAIK